jgi:hypothetical protein
MAMHRPQQALPLVPPRLVEFNPRDGWASPQEWSNARFDWLLAHPDRTIDGVDVVDLIYEIGPTSA